MRRAHGPAAYGYYDSGRSDALEEENEHLVEGLKTKTSALKFLTIDIGNEIRDQKKLIDGLDDDFDRTGGFLSSSVGRVKRLINAGHNRYIFYLILFSLFVFFVIYVILKLR